MPGNSTIYPVVGEAKVTEGHTCSLFLGETQPDGISFGSPSIVGKLSPAWYPILVISMFLCAFLQTLQDYQNLLNLARCGVCGGTLGQM